LGTSDVRRASGRENFLDCFSPRDLGGPKECDKPSGRRDIASVDADDEEDEEDEEDEDEAAEAEDEAEGTESN